MFTFATNVMLNTLNDHIGPLNQNSSGMISPAFPSIGYGGESTSGDGQGLLVNRLHRDPRELIKIPDDGSFRINIALLIHEEGVHLRRTIVLVETASDEAFDLGIGDRDDASARKFYLDFALALLQRRDPLQLDRLELGFHRKDMRSHVLELRVIDDELRGAKIGIGLDDNGPVASTALVSRALISFDRKPFLVGMIMRFHQGRKIVHLAISHGPEIAIGHERCVFNFYLQRLGLVISRLTQGHTRNNEHENEEGTTASSLNETHHGKLEREGNKDSTLPYHRVSSRLSGKAMWNRWHHLKALPSFP